MFLKRFKMGLTLFTLRMFEPTLISLELVTDINSIFRHIWDAIKQIWPDGHWPGEQRHPVFESRL